jgi:hypothetical protein
MATLIEATPTDFRRTGNDEWTFQYGEGKVGQPCGAVFVNRQNPAMFATT